MIPIFEYPANNARLGAFEIVLPMLDAINTVASNRMDGVEQFIQAFVKFVNCDIDEEQFKALKDLGAIKVKSVDGAVADVSIVTQELNQVQTQTLVDYLYQTVLTICGMPNRNGGSSTSDTGSAVIMRDGWTLAESRAKDSELMFKKSEHEVLKLVLRIIRDSENMSEDIRGLRLKNISLQFTRRDYENVQSKSQVLVSMLQQDKIHPRLAFTSSGLFTDPESAYQQSMDYYDTVKVEAPASAEPIEEAK
jgi:SPP1 family phage portal protein